MQPGQIIRALNQLFPQPIEISEADVNRLVFTILATDRQTKLYSVEFLKRGDAWHFHLIVPEWTNKLVGEELEDFRIGEFAASCKY